MMALEQSDITKYKHQIDEIRRTQLERSQTSTGYSEQPAFLTPEVKQEVQGAYRILIVDDAVVGRHALKYFFEDQDAELAFAEDGAQAVAEVEEANSNGEQFDVILMDLVMPVMDGIQATKKIRELGFSMPIIALSGASSDQEREACFAAGCNEFAEKSGEFDVLLSIIERLTQKH